MRSIGISILFAMLFAALCAYTFYVVPGHIEQSLEYNISQVFENNGLPALQIIVDGRDVTLAGEVSSQAHLSRAIELSSSMPGVRVVMSHLSVIKKPAKINKAIVEDLVIGPIQDESVQESVIEELMTN
jgi:hypothetical protein